MILTVEHRRPNISSLWTEECSIHGWCIALPAFVCKSLDTRPTAAMDCCARPVTSGRAAGHQPAAGPAWAAAGRRLAGAVPRTHRTRTHRRAVDGRARSVLGRYSDAWFQAAKRRRGGESAGVPTSQAPARPGPLVPRHVRVPARTSEVAGRQGPSRLVGAAGPPHSLSSRASPSGHAACRWGAAVARSHRRRPHPAATPRSGSGGWGGSWHHPSLRGRCRWGSLASVGPGDSGRELSAPA